MQISPSALESLAALGLGFAFAGLLVSAFELLTRRRAGFGLLEAGGPFALACVPLLVFSAPFIILRNTVRGRRFERRPMGFCLRGHPHRRVLEPDVGAVRPRHG